MARKKKRKIVRRIIHVEYTRVFNEVLKYEEVMDIDLDKIFQYYLKLIADTRKIKNLSKPPTRNDIDALVDLLIVQLNHEPVI